MHASGAGRSDGPRLIYRAGPSVFHLVLVAVLLLILAASLLGGMLLALVVPERPNLVLAAVAMIATTDGRRVTSALTGSRFALHRGESTHDHGSDLLQPARPARAAIEAHRRWLHGAR